MVFYIYFITVLKTDNKFDVVIIWFSIFFTIVLTIDIEFNARCNYFVFFFFNIVLSIDNEFDVAIICPSSPF